MKLFQEIRVCLRRNHLLKQPFSTTTMKLLRKIIIGVGTTLFLFTLTFFLFYIFVVKKDIECQNSIFKTAFLDTDITLPISLVEATKKYNLIHEENKWYSFSGEETLMIVDSRIRSSELGGMVFYLAKLSQSEIDKLQLDLEIKYKKKFESQLFDYSFRHMKINDCTFLVIDRLPYMYNDIFVTKKQEGNTTKYTCRIGFYHGISEQGLINIWAPD